MMIETPIMDDNSEEDMCSHHWLIESPNGPESTGECKICGEIRMFKNSIQITSWESDGSQHRAQGASTPA